MDPLVLQLVEGIVKDKDACGAMAALFQNITQDMKSCQPLWEEFVKHATRLHSCLKSTLLAISAYLDTFQRIADAASAARGSTRDIGTALTRMCLRHRAVEAKVKTFASALAECLILPLQEKLDDWRRTTVGLDKEHSKEYKRQRVDLKKRSVEALRLHKKMHKTKSPELSGPLQLRGAEIHERYQRLEEAQRASLAAAMVEERSRFCRFVACLHPVVQGEVALLGEMVHLTEVMNQLDLHTGDPFTLPAACDQVICDLQTSGDTWRLSASTPASPSVASTPLGSRKSSVCSVSSLASADSSPTHAAAATAAPPAAPGRPRSLSQAAAGGGIGGAGVAGRVASVVSRDSGFANSQDGLSMLVRPPTPPALLPVRCAAGGGESGGESSGTGSPLSPPQSRRGQLPAPLDRPHTISSAYERGGAHRRPMIGSLTFLPARPAAVTAAAAAAQVAAPSPSPPAPPLTERPPVPAKVDRLRLKSKQKPPVVHSHYACPSTVQLPDFNQSVPHMVVPQPVYSNLAELAGLPSEECVTPTSTPVDGPLLDPYNPAAGATPDNEPDTPTTPTNCLPKQFERCESDGSASSGYSSVVATPPVAPVTEAFPPPPDFVLNNFCGEAAAGAGSAPGGGPSADRRPALARKPPQHRDQPSMQTSRHHHLTQNHHLGGGPPMQNRHLSAGQNHHLSGGQNHHLSAGQNHHLSGGQNHQPTAELRPHPRPAAVSSAIPVCSVAGGGGGGGLRRSLSQSCRPPPPVRRHSSVSQAARCWRPHGAVSEAVRSLNAAQHRPAAPAGRAGAAEDGRRVDDGLVRR